jgi:uncharacterized glyoxalase superfamily protein PhnB
MAADPMMEPALAGTLMLYVPDVDAWFKRAADAGATAVMPPTNQFWGDRYGRLTDKWGVRWAIATHIEDVSPQEMEKRGQAAMAQMMAQHKK